MSEKRAKTGKAGQIVLSIRGRERQKIELFFASAWGQDGDLYRLRVNGRWADVLGPDGRFVSPNIVGRLVEKMLTGTTDDAPQPDMPRGTPVLYPTQVIGGQQMYEITRTNTDPILAADGRWYVHLSTWDFKGFFPCDGLERKEVGR